ncbi:MAG: putative manganese-dependent inorganic diphosphatase [Pirellulaceae bacterium]
MSVFVFGHKNPDTDAICAAIAYADLLKQTSRPDAIAACCGAPNKRTEYALQCAGISPPKMIMDVRPEVGAICRRNPVIARETEVVYEVYERMEQHIVSAVPVLDDEDNYVGTLNLLDLLKLVFDGDSDPLELRRINTHVEKIRQVINGEFQHQAACDERDFLLMVGAMSAEGFTRRLVQYPSEQLVVVSGDRPTIQLPALEQGVKVLVITGGYELSPGLLQLAKANNVNVIISPFDTATTTLRIKSARLINAAIQKNATTLLEYESLEEVRRKIERTVERLFPVLNDEGKLVGVLSKTDMVAPPRPQIILVDHNELGQAVTGADEAEILEVLDHHRLGGGLKSAHPIRFVNEPVGSTCTLVARQFRAAGIDPEPGIALCMAAGMISDTLYLRSPTTTDVDRQTLNWLAEHCSIDLETFANDFFQVGSALRTCESEQVLSEDCKEFEEQGIRFSISQIEEIGFELFWNRKDELFASLCELANRNRLDFSALLITDVVSNGSLLLLSSEPESWDALHYPRIERHLYQLDGVVSRKKQLLPLIVRLVRQSQTLPG